jgi:hypothetical protein
MLIEKVLICWEIVGVDDVKVLEKGLEIGGRVVEDPYTKLVQKAPSGVTNGIPIDAKELLEEVLISGSEVSINEAEG